MKNLLVVLSLVSITGLFCVPQAQAGPLSKDTCHRHRHHHHHHRHHHHHHRHW